MCFIIFISLYTDVSGIFLPQAWSSSSPFLLHLHQPFIDSDLSKELINIQLAINRSLDLSMCCHVQQTASCVFSALCQMPIILWQAPTIQSMVAALVLSQLDYCNITLAGLSVSVILHLQSSLKCSSSAHYWDLSTWSHHRCAYQHLSAASAWPHPLHPDLPSHKRQCTEYLSS